MQEITIDSIRVSLSNYQRVVILKLKSKDLYIPIWVGSNEADSIAVKLQKVKLPRPLTHDLMITLLEKLDVSIEYVLVDSMKNETFYSKIAFKINNKIEMIDSRASDAIALAVRFSCPIYVNDEVVNNVGVSLDHLAKTAQNNAQKSLNKNKNSETFKKMVSHHTHIDDVLFGTTGDQLDRLEVVYGEPPKGESMKKNALTQMFGISDDYKAYENEKEIGRAHV